MKLIDHLKDEIATFRTGSTMSIEVHELLLLLDVVEAAEKFVRTFCHAEDCDIEIKHDDEESECTCGYSWFEEVLQKLGET